MSRTASRATLALALALAADVLGAAAPAHAISSRVVIAPAGAGGDQMGALAGSAGDFNGDGYGDVYSISPTLGSGRVVVYFGGPWADEVADLTINGTPGEGFGFSASYAGDVNGDGYSDIVVGAALSSAGGAGSGRAYVYFGGPSPDAVADITITGTANQSLGKSVSGGGDVNHDGFDDVIVGIPGESTYNSNGGAVAIYLGGLAPDASADLIQYAFVNGYQLGTFVLNAGDVNGDGSDDFAASAPGIGTGAEIWVWLSPPAYTGNVVMDLGPFNFSIYGGSIAAVDFNADGYSDIVVGSVSAGKVSVYFGGPGMDNAADVSTSPSGDYTGYSSAAAGDVNGDGYADLIVGAPLRGLSSSAVPGGVDVFYGGPGADAVADIKLYGIDNSGYFGSGVGSAGDFNGDGYGDVVVGAFGADFGAGETGRTFVYAIYPYEVLSPNGGERWAAGSSATVRWRGRDVADLAVSLDGGVTYSTVAAGVGGADLNEYDVTVPGSASNNAKVRVTYAGQSARRSTSDASDAVFRIVPPAAPIASRVKFTPTGAAASDNLGAVIAGGDINGDGFSDVIVGANGNDAGGSNAGRAYVFFGGPGADAVADLTFTGAAANDNLGVAVANAGDVNGDGYNDVIVGASAAGGTGRAYIYYGGPSADAIADVTFIGAAAGDAFGGSVAGAGDVNGDGFADVIVGAQFNDAGGNNAGRAYVFFGGVVPDVNVDLVETGAAATDFLGFSVAGAGDVNRDGCSDYIVGAFHNDANGSDAGRAYVYFGGRTPNETADLVINGAAAGDNLAYCGARAGDLNGDGFGDVIIGALLSDAFATDAGRAYVFFGGPSADGVADITLNGVAASDILGWSVAGVGDVSGDGFDDVAAAATQNDAGGSNAGRVYVVDCNRYVVTAPNGGETWNVGASKAVTWLGASLADLWLSTDGGATYELLDSNVGGSELNSYTVRVPHLPSRFARVRVTPHDPTIIGADPSDSTFTIQTSVLLLALVAQPDPDGGTMVSWSSEPGVGPEGLAGYRLYRIAPGESDAGTRVGPDLIAETRYRDVSGIAGSSYRLTAVNGLAEELELGRTSATSPVVALRAWPSPLSASATLNVEFPVPFAAPGFPATDLDVGLFDLAGRRVATLARGPRAANNDVVSLRWSARELNATRGAGIYFVRVSAPSAGMEMQRKVALVP